MNMTRRLFATLVVTIAPFLGMEMHVLATPSDVPPAPQPREVEQDEAVYECHHPFDLILATALGQKTKVLFPKGMVWLPCFGWTPPTAAAELEAKFNAAGLKADNYIQPMEPLKIFAHTGKTDNKTNKLMLNVDTIKTRRNWLTSITKGNEHANSK